MLLFLCIIKTEDFDFDNILLDEKSYENILNYEISYKTLIGSKPLRVRFDKVHGFIRVYDGARYLVLFSSEKHDAIYSLYKVVWQIPKLIIIVNQEIFIAQN